MPVNRAYVGRSFVADTSFVVGREHIRQFASAIRDDNPVYHDVDTAKAAGYADLVAPPTFLIAVTMWRQVVPFDDPDLGLDYSRVVHGDQRFSLRRPVVAGDEIVMTATITDVRDVRGNDLLTIEYVFTTTSGEEIGRAAAKLVARGTAAGEDES